MKHNYILTSGLGALIGGGVTYILTRRYYESFIDNEIRSVRGYYESRIDAYVKKALKNTENEEEKEEPTAAEESSEKIKKYSTEKEDLKEYVKQLAKNQYISHDRDDEPPKHKKKQYDEIIEIIPEDEFGMDRNYDTIQLTYYDNGILTDDMDEIIDIPEEIVGKDWVDNFNEDDAVYVVNHNHKAYYEILKDITDYDFENHAQRVVIKKE